MAIQTHPRQNCNRELQTLQQRKGLIARDGQASRKPPVIKMLSGESQPQKDTQEKRNEKQLPQNQTFVWEPQRSFSFPFFWLPRFSNSVSSILPLIWQLVSGKSERKTSDGQRSGLGDAAGCGLWGL